MYQEKTASALWSLAGDDVEENFRFQVMMHELLHCIGLAHDEDDKGSLMFPYYHSEWQELQAVDIMQLRLAYCS